MRNDQMPELVGANAGEYEAPTLTVVGEARDVVLGIPMSGWDWRGFSVLQFEFESDEE